MRSDTVQTSGRRGPNERTQVNWTIAWRAKAEPYGVTLGRLFSQAKLKEINDSTMTAIAVRRGHWHDIRRVLALRGRDGIRRSISRPGRGRIDPGCILRAVFLTLVVGVAAFHPSIPGRVICIGQERQKTSCYRLRSCPPLSSVSGLQAVSLPQPVLLAFSR
jgi:hypothetical protein